MVNGLPHIYMSYKTSYSKDVMYDIIYMSPITV